MKRSSSVAALADPEGETKWNWQDDMLATNIRLVAIREEEDPSMKKSNGSLGSMASSRCSSGGSLQGWGTTASRKSYKRDLSSLASLEDHGAPSSASSSKESSCKKESSRSLDTNNGATKGYAQNIPSAADEADSWGFFVDSSF